MYRIVRHAAIASCLIPLAACVGSGGSDEGQTYDWSDVVPEATRQRLTHAVSGAQYQVDAEGNRFPADSIDDLERCRDDDGELCFDGDVLPQDVHISLAREHGDIKVFLVSPESLPQKEGWEFDYGAFLDYSGFRFSQEIECDPCSDDPNYHVVWGSHSYGQPSDVNPAGSGSATWTGVMGGFDSSVYATEGADPIFGDASIEIDDLSDPDVDVSFTSIEYMNSGKSLDDMSWTDLAVTGGAFKDGSSDADRTIGGAFYGPNYEEVGGVFDRDGIVGAFGAKRD